MLTGRGSYRENVEIFQRIRRKKSKSGLDQVMLNGIAGSGTARVDTEYFETKPAPGNTMNEVSFTGSGFAKSLHTTPHPLKRISNEKSVYPGELEPEENTT